VYIFGITDVLGNSTRWCVHVLSKNKNDLLKRLLTVGC